MAARSLESSIRSRRLTPALLTTTGGGIRGRRHRLFAWRCRRLERAGARTARSQHRPRHDRMATARSGPSSRRCGRRHGHRRRAEFFDRRRHLRSARALRPRGSSPRRREFGAWLHEAHHAAKKDAPSGTALLLKRAMEAGRLCASDRRLVARGPADSRVRIPWASTGRRDPSR